MIHRAVRSSGVVSAGLGYRVAQWCPWSAGASPQSWQVPLERAKASSRAVWYVGCLLLNCNRFSGVRQRESVLRICNIPHNHTICNT